MTFNRESSVVPDSIGRIVVTLDEHPETDPETGEPIGMSKSAHVQVFIGMSDGTIKKRRSLLQPHISSAQLSGLLQLMTDLRTKAETEILPE